MKASAPPFVFRNAICARLSRAQNGKTGRPAVDAVPIRSELSPLKDPRFRTFAYYCFLGLAAMVVAYIACEVLGFWLPRPMAAGLLIFIMRPLTGAGLLAGLAGLGLTLYIKNDPRLYTLCVITATLYVFWVRHEALGVSPRWALIYPVGVLLFSLHWILERRKS